MVPSLQCRMHMLLLLLCMCMSYAEGDPILQRGEQLAYPGAMQRDNRFVQLSKFGVDRARSALRVCIPPWRTRLHFLAQARRHRP